MIRAKRSRKDTSNPTVCFRCSMQVRDMRGSAQVRADRENDESTWRRPPQSKVAPRGSLRVITTLELFQHLFAKLVHRDLFVTDTLSDDREMFNLKTRVASAASFKRAWLREIEARL
jgi:hypothetical protein